MRTKTTASFLLPFLQITLLMIAVAAAQVSLGASTRCQNAREFGSASADNRQIEQIASIQEAINMAENGSTVYVSTGMYFEHVVVNKTVTLIGAENFASIIDGSNNGTIMEITADDVTVAGFKIQDSGYGWTKHGIYVYRANNCTIRNNYLSNVCHNIKLNYSSHSQILENMINGTMAQPTMYGIRIENSVSCTAAGNQISDCVGAIHLENATECTVAENTLTRNSQGIRLYSPCANNKIFENVVRNNTYDGMIETMPTNLTLFNNSIFHNNFVENMYPFIYRVSGTTWDDGYPSGGNYWSRYNGTDKFSGRYQNETGADGIGDLEFAVNTYDEDKYPLAHPYGSVRNQATNLTYLTIQSAIEALETLDGHTIVVKNGVYLEHIVINKTLSLMGENKNRTIIDGGNADTVLKVEADSVNLTGFTIRNSGSHFPPYGDDCGVLLDHCAECVLIDNAVADNRIGIYLLFSEFTVLEDNTVFSNSENGILLWYSPYTTLLENQIFNNSYNFAVFGNELSHFNNTVPESNSVDERKIQYLIGAKDEILEQNDIGSLYLISCTNITVHNLNLTRNGQALFCYNVTESTIENVTATSNSYGIYLSDCTRNTVANNTCTDNWVNICLQNSQNNTIVGNRVRGGEKSISLYEANSNVIKRNTIEDAYYGIRLFASNSNKIYNNNFLTNGEQIDIVSSYQNVFDNGLEGNHWSDYNGTDLNGDGIGEEPYFIDTDNKDIYPLMDTYLYADVNHDETVNMRDIGLCCSSFDSMPGQPRWNPHCDIDEDGRIGWTDVEVACADFGKTNLLST